MEELSRRREHIEDPCRDPVTRHAKSAIGWFHSVLEEAPVGGGVESRDADNQGTTDGGDVPEMGIDAADHPFDQYPFPSVSLSSRNDERA